MAQKTGWVLLDRCPLCDHTSYDAIAIHREQLGLCRCTACEIVFLNPRPRVAKYSPGHVERPYVPNAKKRGMLSDDLVPDLPRIYGRYRKLADLAALLKPTSSVLDVGCGIGLSTLALKHVGIDAIGVDVNEEFVAFARDHLRLDVRLHDAVAEPMPQRAPVATVNSVLEHLPDPVGFLSSLRTNVIEPGGALVITVPKLLSLEYIRDGETWHNINGGHIWYFTEQSLGMVARKASFTVEHVYRPSPRFEGLLRYLMGSCPICEQQVGGRLVLAGLLALVGGCYLSHEGSRSPDADVPVAPRADSGPSSDAAPLRDARPRPSMDAGPGPGIVFAEGTDVRALAVDDERLYWAEYGTIDDADTHRLDGTVLAVPFAGGVPELVADGLPGPVGLGVTAGHVYVYVDRLDGTAGNALLRAALSGGDASLVQEGAEMSGRAGGLCRGCFASSGDRAFWYFHERRVFMLADDMMAPEQVASVWIQELATDSAYLYLFDGNALQRIPLGGGTLEPVVTPPLRSVDTAASNLIGIERPAGTTNHYLSVGPPGSPTWTRLAALPTESGGTVRTSGVWYAVDAYTAPTGATERMLLTGRIDGPAPATARVADIERQRWVASPVGVFWVAGRTTISRVPW